MPTNSNDNKGGDLAEITDLVNKKPKGTVTTRRNSVESGDLPDSGRTQATKTRLVNKSRGIFKTKMESNVNFKDLGETQASDTSPQNFPGRTRALSTDSRLTASDMLGKTSIGGKVQDLHADLAAKHNIYSGQDRANNSIFGKAPDPGRTSAIKERFKQSRTSGNPMTQGETKYSAIGANKSPDMGRVKAAQTAISPEGYATEQRSNDPGRGLANAVREIRQSMNDEGSRIAPESAFNTATKAFKGQRDIALRAPSLNLKAQSALKGGGGQGETDKLSDLGSTQDEINKSKKAMKGFNIVPEGY